MREVRATNNINKHVEIVHKVLVRHQLQREVAKEHRLKQILVSRLEVKYLDVDEALDIKKVEATYPHMKPGGIPPAGINPPPATIKTGFMRLAFLCFAVVPFSDFRTIPARFREKARV